MSAAIARRPAAAWSRRLGTSSSKSVTWFSSPGERSPGYKAAGGPVGVGTATAKSMVLNIVLVNLIGMVGSQVFWGGAPNAPIGD